MIFIALQCLVGPRWTGITGDSYEYARISLQILGKPRAQAEQEAWKWWCASKASEEARTARVDPIHFRKPSPETASYRRCAQQYAVYAATTSAQRTRYQAIFNGRPGYPALASPAIAAFGVGDGLWMMDVFITAVAALLTGLLLHAAGSGTLGMLLGHGVYLLSPLGVWSMRPLADGTLNATVITVLLAAWCLLGRRHVVLASGALATGLIVACAVKYSSGLLLDLCLISVVVLCWILAPNTRHAGTVILAALASTAAAATLSLIRLLGLPGTRDTLQDTFTRHFHRPDVANPWTLLAELNVHYWEEWLQQQAALPLFLVLTGVAGWALLRWAPALGYLAVAAAAMGVLTVVSHPLGTDGDRLGVLIWTPVAFGLPFAITRLPGLRAKTNTGTACPSCQKSVMVSTRQQASDATAEPQQAP
ncbi:hypothetical protein ACH47C_29800 [Streptomyces rishiriensis]|uniref:hypothetical protein n=1 Tax=Streptomyces rishiriensis TaxID=68264 RepID=UPI0033F2E56C